MAQQSSNAQSNEDLTHEELVNQLEQLKDENKVYKDALKSVYEECIRGRLFANVEDPKGLLWHTKVKNALKYVFTPKNAKTKK